MTVADELEPCPYEWYAPRADVADSVHVRHVCHLGRTDHMLHVCPCGRNTIG